MVNCSEQKDDGCWKSRRRLIGTLDWVFAKTASNKGMARNLMDLNMSDDMNRILPCCGWMNPQTHPNLRGRKIAKILVCWQMGLFSKPCGYFILAVMCVMNLNSRWRCKMMALAFWESLWCKNEANSMSELQDCSFVVVILSMPTAVWHDHWVVYKINSHGVVWQWEMRRKRRLFCSWKGASNFRCNSSVKLGEIR